MGNEESLIPLTPSSFQGNTPMGMVPFFPYLVAARDVGPRGDQLLGIFPKLRRFLGLGNSCVKTSKSQVSWDQRHL